MKKSASVFFLLILVILLLSRGDDDLPGKRSNTVTIGKHSWYTGQNSPETILRLAREKNKPILVLFAVPLHSTFVRMTSSIFSDDTFVEIAGNLILVHIAPNDTNSGEFVDTFKPTGSMSFNIVSPDGNILAYSFPRMWRLDELKQWVELHTSEKSYYGVTQKLKKDPGNRQLMVQQAQTMQSAAPDRKLEFLRRIIAMNPDPTDPVTQQANELLVHELYIRVYKIRNPDTLYGYALSLDDEFMRAFKPYYPDKFRFSIQKDYQHQYIVAWNNALGKYEQAITHFNEFLKANNGQVDFRKNKTLLLFAITALMELGQEKEAEAWLVQIEDYVRKEEAAQSEAQRQRRPYSNSLVIVYQVFAELYGQTQNIAKAEYYGNKVIAILNRTNKEMIPGYKERHAIGYGMFAQEYLQNLEKKYQTAGESGFIEYNCKKAELFGVSGKIDEANKLLDQILAKLDQYKGNEATVLGRVARTMVEAGFADQKTIGIAQRSLKYGETAENLEILASAHAALKQFNKAVSYGRKALSLADDKNRIARLKLKLPGWTARI